MDQKFDTIVIGFGNAGKTLAAKLAKQGEKVALIEKDARMYGGTCINVGCIPSKRLVMEAELAPAHDFEAQSEYYHVAVQEKKKLTAALRMANYNKLIDAGVQVINGTASFLDGKTIEVKGAHDTVQILSASKFIINTGARPMIPAVPGVENNRFVFTSETMMDNETLPRRLTIIGGGYIGLEFASMYARFGSKVTILQNGSVFLPKEDRDMAEAVENVLKSYGVFVITGAGLKEIKEGTAVYTKNGEEDTLDGDAILLATGRGPNTEGLHAERAGVELTKRGMEGFSGSVSLHGSYFRRILVRSVFLWDLYAFYGVQLSLSCPYGGIHFRRFTGVRRSDNAYEPVCPAGCLCYGADGAVPPFVLRYFHAQEI